MKRFVPLSVCLVATLFSQVANSQLTTEPAESNRSSTGSAPVAHVYVVGRKVGKVNQIYAFAAARDGRLTPVSGSPFPGNVSNIAVDGKYLFGASTDFVDIDSFSIASDGALKRVGSISGQKYNSGNCGGPGPLFVDRTGASLYDLDFYGDSCANNTYQSFRVEKSTGALNYLGRDGSDAWANVPLSFAGNNGYAYGAVCINDMYWEIYGFARHSDGMLIAANISAPMPTAKGGDFYCPSAIATDRTNHLVLSLQAVDGQTFNPDGATQLAAYTVEESGNLSTKNTREDMAETAVGFVNETAISPSGKILAVCGTAGLQLFHFDGSNPITHYTGLLTRDQIEQFFWDSDNHLYAISKSSGKLFVFSITPKSFSQAPGSPYAITQPKAVTVLPAT